MFPKDGQDYFLIAFIILAILMMRKEHFSSKKKSDRRVVDKDSSDEAQFKYEQNLEEDNKI